MNKLATQNKSIFNICYISDLWIFLLQAELEPYSLYLLTSAQVSILETAKKK